MCIYRFYQLYYPTVVTVYLVTVYLVTFVIYRLKIIKYLLFQNLSFFSGIYKNSFICQLCQETNIYYEPFHHITVQPNTDIFSYLAKDFRENKNLTCRKCTTQSCQFLFTSYQETPNILLIQINRFCVSNLHGRPQKNNHPFAIYENIKLGLINYTLLGLIEHHGVFIDSGHYVSYIRQSNKWYHCDDKHNHRN